jgi:hypothetical protein
MMQHILRSNMILIFFQIEMNYSKMNTHQSDKVGS